MVSVGEHMTILIMVLLRLNFEALSRQQDTRDSDRARKCPGRVKRYLHFADTDLASHAEQVRQSITGVDVTWSSDADQAI